MWSLRVMNGGLKSGKHEDGCGVERSLRLRLLSSDDWEAALTWEIPEGVDGAARGCGLVLGLEGKLLLTLGIERRFRDCIGVPPDITNAS